MSAARIIASMAIMTGLLVAPLSAQNLLSNPNFDSDVTGWWDTWVGRLDWVSDDGDLAGSGPGCMEVADTLNNGACAAAIQNVIAVAPNTSYVLSGVARLPAGSIAYSAAIWVEWYDGGGNFISWTPFYEVTTTVDGPWTPGSWVVMSPSGAAEASVRPAVCMASSGSEESIARWDDLFFGLEGGIFVDGFESGDTTAWSSTVP